MAKKAAVKERPDVETPQMSSSPWGQVSSRVNEVNAEITAKEKQDSREGQEFTLRSMSRKERRALYSKAEKSIFKDYTHLMAMKPREGYVFRSDYFEVDNGVACVLGYFHDESAKDDLPPFWGVGLIPHLPSKVTAVLLEQVTRFTESWLKKSIDTAERLDKLDAQEQAMNGGTRSSRRRTSKVSMDTERIIAELQDGACYLMVHLRILLKAPDLETLDEVVEDLRRRYVDVFGNLSVAPYHGLQRHELSSLFSPNSSKKGRAFGFTSTEFAGAFNLVTNGLNDRSGEYVGYMVGDVNNSGVLMDVDYYRKHVVVADNDRSRAPRMKNAQVADMWGSKISQAALLNNKRVVHLVLNDSEAKLMGTLGPEMRTITSVLDMNRGDVNMFEIFGDRKDELNLFQAHMTKLVLMAEQAYEPTDSDRSIIRNSLQDTLIQFYVDQNMWHRNAKNNRERLRIVGIPHEEVPRLQLFVTYLDQRYKEMSNLTARDDDKLHAYSVLSGMFKNLLDANGDLFNTYTSSIIDDAQTARRVIYDFSSLRRRGTGIAMAQLVNVMGFATSALGKGDSLIIHGAELIDDSVKKYMSERFDALHARGGRTVLCYNSIKGMLESSDFNKFNEADWTAIGAMTEAQVPVYEKKLAKKIPVDMINVITQRDQGYTFLRRGTVNVVFKRDLALGVNAKRVQYDGAVAPGRHRGSAQNQDQEVLRRAEAKKQEEKTTKVRGLSGRRARAVKK